MNKYPSLIEPAHRGTEMAQEFGRAEKHFSLTIRGDDGSTMLETRVEHMHEAFQRLIDWSINEVDQDVSAVISGPNGFCSNHRIKASPNFSWIEAEDSKASFS
jgi:hypothetical protein